MPSAEVRSSRKQASLLHAPNGVFYFLTDLMLVKES